MDICKQLFHKSRSPQLFNRIVFLRTPQNAAQHPQPASVVSFATDADMIDLMNEPPSMMTNKTGTIIHRSLLSASPEKRVTSPYSTSPLLTEIYIPAMLYIVIDTVSANQTYRLG